MRAIVRLLVALCCIFSGSAAARAEKRVALIVGNASYAHIAGLPNVPNDAAAMAALFKAANFDAIDVVENLGVGELRRALKWFAGKAAYADVAVLYYAGHGIEVGQTNYLIPADARLATDFDVEDEAVPLDRVLQALAPARRLRLVLLDACRENPFLKSMKRTVATRSVGRGLGRVEPAAANTLIAFATRPNATAEDGKGPNSPFTAALVKHLLTPGLDLRIALGKVRDEVMASTGGRQEPYVTSSLGGEVVAILPGAAPATTAARPNEAAEAWAAVKDSTSIAQLEVIASRHKGTVYADFAQARLAELRKQQTALAVSPSAPKPSVDGHGPAWLAAPLVNYGNQAIGDRALSGRPHEPFMDCVDCPIMVVVPAGSFMMGSPPGEEGREPADKGSESPQHRVTIARAFAVGKFEVTFAEWDACVAGGGCTYVAKDFGSGRAKRPVANVSWNDITGQYLPWLNLKTGKAYRLLTEAEWEYAARAGTTTPYAFGNRIARTQAQYSEGDSGSAGGAVEVGSFPANAFGLHDTHGNVWEWVQDCWNGSYNSAPSDGSAWTSGAARPWITAACDSRILRGGSWFLQMRNSRSANRFGWPPGARTFDMGFRVARDFTR